MANQKLLIDVIARDKTKQAFNGVRAGLTNLRSAVFSVQSAIIGIGGGLAVKSILNVGSTVEQLSHDSNQTLRNMEFRYHIRNAGWWSCKTR